MALPPAPATALPHALRIATITVSDTRTAETDTSGPAIAEELAALAGCDLVRHRIVPDDAAVLASLVREEATRVDAVIISGGTGIAPRDVSYEAIAGLLDKPLDGFGEAFRRLSWDEIGPRAILSRATAGTLGRCLVFLVPGSENATRLAARKLIAPILAHARGPRERPHPPQAVTITILYFAAVRDLVACGEEQVTLPIGVGTVGALATFLEAHRPALAGRLGAVRFARNEEFATKGDVVADGDVIALIPPVAGG